jgi:hypothetical protein
MTVTIDPRPTYFGDRMVVTGTYTGGAATETIDLTSFFSRIDAFVVNPNASVIQEVDSADATDGAAEHITNLLDVGSLDTARTTITVRQASDQDNVQPGSFLAIGRRS